MITNEQLNEIIEKYLKLTAIESMEIVAVEGKPTILDDKIGGDPYIPLDFEYPIDEQGKPYLLLLQINLANVKLSNWPNYGILEIFTQDSYDYPTKYKIFCFPEGKKYHTDLPKIDCEETAGFVNKPIKIVLNNIIEHMPISDYRASQKILECVNDVLDTKYENFDLVKKKFSISLEDLFVDYEQLWNIPKASVGGYADFIQHDKRKIEDKKDYCLFKLDSNFSVNVDIGDFGILSVVIDEIAVKNHRFSEAILDWDCF